MNVTYGLTRKLKRKTLNLEKTHYKDVIAITGVDEPFTDECTKLKQFRKKKGSLHEAIARKGRKNPNIRQKRNSKNNKQIEDKKFGIFCLNDKVRIFG